MLLPSERGISWWMRVVRRKKPDAKQGIWLSRSGDQRHVSCVDGLTWLDRSLCVWERSVVSSTRSWFYIFYIYSYVVFHVGKIPMHLPNQQTPYTRSCDVSRRIQIIRATFISNPFHSREYDWFDRATLWITIQHTPLYLGMSCAEWPLNTPPAIIWLLCHVCCRGEGREINGEPNTSCGELMCFWYI